MASQVLAMDGELRLKRRCQHLRSLNLLTCAIRDRCCFIVKGIVVVCVKLLGGPLFNDSKLCRVVLLVEVLVVVTDELLLNLVDSCCSLIELLSFLLLCHFFEYFCNA